MKKQQNNKEAQQKTNDFYNFGKVVFNRTRKTWNVVRILTLLTTEAEMAPSVIIICGIIILLIVFLFIIIGVSGSSMLGTSTISQPTPVITNIK